MSVESGETLALLDASNSSTIHFLTFSPDGRNLAVAQSDQLVDIWDLKAVRERLDSLGVAGELPDIFQGDTSSGSLPPIERIDVRGADYAGLRLLAIRHILRNTFDNFRLLFAHGLSDPEELVQRGNRWNRLGHWEQALRDYRASLERRGDAAEVANNLAWVLVAFPGRGNMEEALRCARMAVAKSPETPSYHNTLGVAPPRRELWRRSTRARAEFDS